MRDIPHCWPCDLLGRWQHGPLNWALRRHLRGIGRRMDREETSV